MKRRLSVSEFDQSFGQTSGAFGNPDGRRANLSDFVTLERTQGFGDVASENLDNRIRVFVGRKGAGKTVYMRRVRDAAEQDASVKVLSTEAEESQYMTTSHVMRVAHWFQPQVLSDVWIQVWNRALLYSLTSYLIRHRYFRDYVDKERRDDLEHRYKRFLFSLGNRPRTVFTTARELISSHRNGYELEKTLDDPGWDDLEGELAELMHDLPPVLFYLDGLDEAFSQAPMYWLQCQKGLFHHVMRLLRHSRLGGRLHLVIGIRDLVLSSVYRGEHAPRYRNDPHIRLLNWSRSSISFLLKHKITHLDPAFVSPKRPTPTTLPEWIGIGSVTNRQGEVEDATVYALRHSQLIPRDVIILGNYIGDIMSKKVASGEGMGLSEPELVRIVSDLARFGGFVQISQCANHLVSEEAPIEASTYDFADFYTSSVEFETTYADVLLDLLRELELLRVPYERILALDREAEAKFDRPMDVSSVLWQNGLLGYRHEGRDVFYSLDNASRFRLPQRADEYVLHPSLHECAGLKGSGPAVVPT